MDDKDIIELYTHSDHDLREKLLQQALIIAEQNVLIDKLKRSSVISIRWAWLLKVLSVIVIAYAYTIRPISVVAESCTKFEGLGFKTEICNTTSWVTIIMTVVLVVAIYAGVKFINNIKINE